MGVNSSAPRSDSKRLYGGSVSLPAEGLGVWYSTAAPSGPRPSPEKASSCLCCFSCRFESGTEQPGAKIESNKNKNVRHQKKQTNRERLAPYHRLVCLVLIGSTILAACTFVRRPEVQDCNLVLSLTGNDVRLRSRTSFGLRVTLSHTALHIYPGLGPALPCGSNPRPPCQSVIPLFVILSLVFFDYMNIMMSDARRTLR